MEDNFISFAKYHYSQNIICIAGDFYNNYKRTLAFIKRLEENQIKGFFVLGNHDYWNNKKMSHLDIINLFSLETNYKYFKFLVTGRKYYYKNICVIGDTGWTSFRRGKRKVFLRQFKGLLDTKYVKDFKPKKIISLHDKWVTFANDILKKEEKVLIITHFPMVDFTKKDKDCWWSSTTKLKGDNSWRIFGHTHQTKGQQYNNASSQQGYHNIDIETLQRKACRKLYESINDFEGSRNRKEYEMKMYAYIEANWHNTVPENQYNFSNFRKLKKVIEQTDIITINNIQNLSTFYSPILVSNDYTDLALISNIKKRGYIRCSANKYNFTALANQPADYLEQIKEEIKWYLKEVTYIGYVLSDNISIRVIDSIYHSIAILEKGNISDVRIFMTAAVITGYLYNRKPYMIECMRPLDDYDIIRFWMMFLTIKRFNINKNNIYSVKSNKKKPIHFKNVEIYLPSINGKSLNVTDVISLLQQTSLLSSSS